MRSYRVTFNVPAEVIVLLNAEDEECAADEAWERAQAHLQSTGMIDYTTHVSVNADLDGVGADEVVEA